MIPFEVKLRKCVKLTAVKVTNVTIPIHAAILYVTILRSGSNLQFVLWFCYFPQFSNWIRMNQAFSRPKNANEFHFAIQTNPILSSNNFFNYFSSWIWILNRKVAAALKFRTGNLFVIIVLVAPVHRPNLSLEHTNTTVRWNGWN